MAPLRQLLQILLLHSLLFSESSAQTFIEQNQNSIDNGERNHRQRQLRTRNHGIQNDAVEIEQERSLVQEEETNSFAQSQDDEINIRRLQPGRSRDLRFYTLDLQFNRVIRPVSPNRRYVANNIFNDQPQGGSFFQSNLKSSYQTNPQTGSVYFVGSNEPERTPFTVDLGSTSSSFASSPRNSYRANTLIIPDPTRVPTMPPVPTFEPTPTPTLQPTTAPPTRSPTKSPTPVPTKNPTPNPTPRPTRRPTRKPTRKPTRNPTPRPTRRPTPQPTPQPTPAPTP